MTTHAIGPDSVGGRRFITLSDLHEVLNISMPQAYALVRSGELRAIQVGGRGQWRIEVTELEAYINRQYDRNEERLRTGHGEPGGDE
jgi:excisionase family DNA binding protein